MNNTIVNRYATALLNRAKVQGIVQLLYNETSSLEEILRVHPQFMAILSAPHIEITRKISILEKVFKGKVSATLLYFVELVCRKNRVDLLQDTLKQYCKFVDQERGLFEAFVTSAREMTFLEKMRLKNALEKFTGKKLRMVHVIDSKILGGIIFRFGDLYIDRSIRGNLSKLRTCMQGIDVNL